MAVSIKESVALVTGANRGIGRAFVDELLARGARKVYAGARRPESLATLVDEYGDRVVPLRLDVTSAAEVDQAAALAGDVDVLVNNAGVATDATLIHSDALDGLRHELEVNVLGLLRVTQAFTPALRRNGPGAIVNLASVASFANFFMFPTYSASKAAVHSLTQALRVVFAGDDIVVTAVYPGPVDTDMAEAIPFEKTPPDTIARMVLDGVEAGEETVLPDPMSKEMGGAYYSDPRGLEDQVAQMAAEFSRQAAN